MGQNVLMIYHVSCDDMIDHALIYAKFYVFGLQPDNQHQKYYSLPSSLIVAENYTKFIGVFLKTLNIS